MISFSFSWYEAVRKYIIPKQIKKVKKKKKKRHLWTRWHATVFTRVAQQCYNLGMEASPTQDPVGGGGKWRKRRRSSTEPPLVATQLPLLAQIWPGRRWRQLEGLEGSSGGWRSTVANSCHLCLRRGSLIGFLFDLGCFFSSFSVLQFLYLGCNTNWLDFFCVICELWMIFLVFDSDAADEKKLGGDGRKSTGSLVYF